MSGFSKSAGSAISSIGNDVGSYAKLKESMSSTDKGERMAGEISAIIEGISTVIGVVSTQIAENKRILRDWNNAIKEAAQATRLYAIDVLKYESSNAWGVESPYAKITATSKQFAEAYNQSKSVLSELAADGRVQVGTKKGLS